MSSFWQSKRLGALNLFKSGQCNVLICTDVASRGLDIPSVDMVINYDIPSNSKVSLLFAKCSVGWLLVICIGLSIYKFVI